MSSQEETVIRLEHEVGNALALRNVEAIGNLFAEDFVGINPMSMEITRADVLVQIASADYEPESIVNDVLRVRVFGDIAVVTARGTAKGRYKKQQADMVFLYTRIWVRREGIWRAVAAHASQVSEP